MAVYMKSARELYVWNKKVLSLGGIWPLEQSFLKFYIGYFYFIVHVVLAVGDFVSVFGDMTLMIANLSETSVQAMVGVKMLVLRHSVPLQRLVRKLEAGAKNENYRNEEERKLYLAYNHIGRTFFRTGSYVAFGAVLFYHFRPMEDIIKAALQNEKMPYVLPYRMRLFFNLSDTRTYILVYLSQSPMFYYYYAHTMSVCFLCTLIVHVAGELSVLAYRIRSIKNPKYPNDVFRDIVVKHQKIVSTAKSIDDIFNVVLLEELVISTMLIGLATYSVLSKSLMVSMFEFFFFVNYTMALVLLILVYCITGEYLICESKNVHDAYYECQWYELPTNYRRHLIICMSRAQRPLQLTAGRFYVFSLSKFGSVDPKSADLLYAWNKRVLLLGGLWPLEPDFLKFYILFIYLIVHMIMAIGDLVSVFGEMSLTIANLSETCVQLMIAVKMLVIRHSGSLETVVRRLESRIEKKCYKEQEERNLYLDYMTVGKRFFRIGSYLSLSTTWFYYLRPCENVLIAVLRNETILFDLPFRMNLYFTITNIRTYALVYLSQLPMCYFYYFNSISVCFIFTLVVHVAGELSVVANRIRRIEKNLITKNVDNLKSALHGLIMKHDKVISTAAAIDDSYNLVLLEELVIFTLLIGLSCYTLLSISISTSMLQYVSILCYVLAFVELIFVYCIAGDYLIRESANVQNAYYECNWYEMPLKSQKDIILCMVRAQQPLQLTAGGFYIFSLGQFSGVLKSSMAYISMLRTVN